MTSRTALSIQDKLNLIKEIEEDHKEKKEICLKYKCDISTLNRILKKKYELSEAASINSQKKRNRKGIHDNVEKALWIWYKKQKQEDELIGSQWIMNQAKNIAAKFGTPFEPSNHWLFRWKKRFNINNEVSDNTKPAESSSDNYFLGLLKKYRPENIMCAAETALFYKALPSQNHLQSDIKIFVEKEQKERLTLLFICDAASTFKRVYAIGKSKSPSCLQNVNLPLSYFCNEKALITTKLWQEILHSLDIEMQNMNRRIILFVDTSACHVIPHLANVLVKQIPPNFNTLSQPLDQGIISSFKTYYRQIIVKKHISALERDMTIKEFYRSISCLDALHFIKRAWCLVTPSCISNCFKKAGFIDSTEENYFLLDTELDFLNVIPECAEYIRCDDDKECHEESAESVVNIKPDVEDDSDSDMEIETEDANQVPSLKEALTALNVVQKYCFSHNIEISLDQVETELLKTAANHVVYNDPLQSIY